MYDINDDRAAVFAVQSLLRDTGRDIKPDGIYGKETLQAVKAFQISKGIIPTGRVDLETFNALVLESKQPSEYRCVVIPPDTLEGGVISPGEESSTVLIIQALLKSLEVIFSFEPIELNGIYDDITAAAVKDVQRINGLREDGVIDPLTHNAILSEYEKYKNNG